MKSLEELYEEARKNPELISAFTEAMAKNRLEGFLKEQSCDASLEEAQTFLTAQLGKTQALSDEELDNVAGGKGNSGSCGGGNSGVTFRCSNCGQTYHCDSPETEPCPYCGRYNTRADIDGYHCSAWE